MSGRRVYTRLPHRFSSLAWTRARVVVLGVAASSDGVVPCGYVLWWQCTAPCLGVLGWFVPWSGAALAPSITSAMASETRKPRRERRRAAPLSSRTNMVQRLRAGQMNGAPFKRSQVSCVLPAAVIAVSMSVPAPASASTHAFLPDMWRMHGWDDAVD